MTERANRRPYLFVGLSVACVPALLMAFGVLIPGFNIDVELHNKTFEYNLSMYLYIALIFTGVAITALYFKVVKTRFALPEASAMKRKPGVEVIVSVPWSRFLAGGLLVAVGALTFNFFGLGFTDRNKVGLWLYLGGPSVFFPSGLLPLIIGVVLVLYAIAATKVVTVREHEGALDIRETRLLTQIHTPIPVNAIRTMHSTNVPTGPRLLWIVVFSFQIFLLIVDGLSFFGNPHAFGTGPLVGGMYVLSACIQLVSLILLLFGGQHSLTVITGERIYTINYHVLPWLKDAPLSRGTALVENVLGTTFPSAFHENKQELRHPLDYKRLVYGLGLLLVPIVSRAFYIYAGELLWFPFLMFGGFVLVQWVKNDFATRGARVIRAGRGDNGPQYLFSSRGWFHDEYFLNIGAEQGRVDPAPTIRPCMLLPPGHLVLIGVAMLIGLDILTVVLLAPAGNPFAAGAIALHVCLGIGFLLLAFLTSFDPRRMIELRVAHWTFQVPAASNNDRSIGWLARVIGLVKQRPRAFILLVIEITVAFLLGAVISIAFSL
jgi:hypothetical protein